MRRVLVIRFLQALLALWVITIIVFGLSHLTGSPIDALLPDDASPEQIDNLIRHWGLDRPFSTSPFSATRCRAISANR